MSGDDIRDLWEAIGALRDHMANQNAILARVEALLIERGKAIDSINSNRKCAENNERLKTLERIVWGTVAAVMALVVRTMYEWAARH